MQRVVWSCEFEYPQLADGTRDIQLQPASGLNPVVILRESFICKKKHLVTMYY